MIKGYKMLVGFILYLSHTMVAKKEIHINVLLFNTNVNVLIFYIGTVLQGNQFYAVITDT